MFNHNRFGNSKLKKGMCSMIGYIKQAVGSERAKRALWSMIIMAVSYLVITNKHYFTPPPF
jgi:hypothetical protein